jgi:hypothetical protein
MTGHRMRAGVVLPGGTAAEQLEQAALAEQAGWDGVFVWEAGYGVDAWTLLAAVAARTSRVRLGTMLTPLPWRRPWKLASQVATLDQISGGRATLAVGIGAIGTGLPDTGEITDTRARAERLDEGIDLIQHLWAGGSNYRGQHYQYECEGDDLARAATPDDARAVRAWLTDHGAGPGLDMMAEGETPAGDPAAATARVAPWAAAGCTWWLETRWQMPHDSPEHTREIRDRLAAGPPLAST